MPPEGFHTVRTHRRRNPRPGRKKMSGWTIAALVAGVWLWGQVIGFGDTSEKAPEPAPAVSAPAQR